MAEATGTSGNSGGLGSGGAGGLRVPQEPSLKAGVVLTDERVDFLREQAFCVLRVKTDKWNRFIGAEENQKIILDFLDHIWTNRLLLFTGPGGTLHAGNAQVRNTHTGKRKINAGINSFHSSFIKKSSGTCFHKCVIFFVISPSWLKSIL